jgi:hypothetical protein
METQWILFAAVIKYLNKIWKGLNVRIKLLTRWGFQISTLDILGFVYLLWLLFSLSCFLCFAPLHHSFFLSAFIYLFSCFSLAFFSFSYFFCLLIMFLVYFFPSHVFITFLWLSFSFVFLLLFLFAGFLLFYCLFFIALSFLFSFVLVSSFFVFIVSLSLTMCSCREPLASVRLNL